MSLLKRLLNYLMGESDKPEPTRVFLKDEELIAVIRDVAKQQSRAEEEVIADFTKVGLNQFLTQSELQDRWDSLSHREQQVVALVCLGSRHYEIAQTLGIAPETVKTHLQHVYDKLHLRSRKELRLALKDWDFQDWWEQNRHE
jgi:ATP/maltotriose-dependent transcriptional regulator MalT